MKLAFSIDQYWTSINIRIPFLNIHMLKQTRLFFPMTYTREGSVRLKTFSKDKSLLCSSRLHLFDQKYIKNSNIMKCY